MQPIMEMKNVMKSYAVKDNVIPVLHGIDLNVYQGEFAGIMGPSGSGKTTLLNLAATIDEPTSGEIVIDGQSVLQMNEADLSEKTLAPERLAVSTIFSAD